MSSVTAPQEPVLFFLYSGLLQKQRPIAGESTNTASAVEPQQQKYVTPASGMANLEITVHPALTVTLQLRHHTLWRQP